MLKIEVLNYFETVKLYIVYIFKLILNLYISFFIIENACKLNVSRICSTLSRHEVKTKQ